MDAGLKASASISLYILELMRDKSIATGTMVAAAVAALLLMVYTGIYGPKFSMEGNLGLCLPSPNLWPISDMASKVINWALILCGLPFLYLFNKQFNFIGRLAPLTIIVFLLLYATNPWISQKFSTSTLLCVVNMICLWVLCDTHKSRNATQEYFFIATCLSLGSMVAYSFIPMILAYTVGGILMKSLRWREGVAMLMGFVAPYWVGAGMGLIPIESFKMPAVTPIFEDFKEPGELLATLLSIGTASLIALLLSMSNYVKLYAGNTRIRIINVAINMLGYVSLLCMAIDYNNLSAYLGTLYLWVAVQIGTLCNINRYLRPDVILYILSSIFLAFYIWICFL